MVLRRLKMQMSSPEDLIAITTIAIEIITTGLHNQLPKHK
jgi:hypothetical protein